MSHDPDLRLSKAISHALRHAPEAYGLRPDPQGWVPLEALVEGLARSEAAFRGLGVDDVLGVVVRSDKQRFETDSGLIRARYGHSLAGQVAYAEAEPPAVLHHGTAAATVAAIRAEGLKPMSRQYVHLSATRELAVTVGRRRDAAPVVLAVEARRAHEAGMPFHDAGLEVWLSGPIPPRFLSD